jgi:nicotinamidase-related amidase
MADLDRDRPALLIIDMVKDNFDEKRGLPITPLAKKIIPNINRLARLFRRHDWPVVFSTDAFHRDDFIFSSRMEAHSLAGTKGAEIIDELDREPDDLWLPKPRFSAFFETHLAAWLKQRQVGLCAVGGIATNFCVLTTALDAICHDFKAFLLEDCAATYSDRLHQQTLALYRRNPLFPLLQVASSAQLIEELDAPTIKPGT